MVSYIEDGDELPKTIFEANFSQNRLHTLRTRNSAAYKGVYALLMNDDTKDWITATRIDFSSYMSESIDIHHIFPVSWCEKNGIHPDDYNCIINKTPLSGRTNRIVSGDAPGKYLDRVMKHVGIDAEDFEKILRSHILEPVHLYSDNFRAFFDNRKEQILLRIEKAMGKQIHREVAAIEEGVFIDEEQDTNDFSDMAGSETDISKAS
jgi:hypothetical protein